MKRRKMGATQSQTTTKQVRTNNSIDNENEDENTNDLITENTDLKENLMCFWTKTSKFDKENFLVKRSLKKLRRDTFLLLKNQWI